MTRVKWYLASAVIVELLAMTSAMLGFHDVSQMAGAAGLVLVGAAVESARRLNRD